MLFSCTKESIKNIQVPSNGKISGRVILSTRNFYFTNESQGVSVNIPELNQTTQTDSSGLYIFRNIPQGTYTLCFQKQGFGDLMIFNVNCYGNGEVNPDVIHLYNNPTYTFYDLYVHPNDTNYNLSVGFNTHDPDQVTMQAVMAFGLTPDFSINDKSCLYICAISSIHDNSHNFTYVNYSDLVILLEYMGKETKDKTIYIKLYPYDYSVSGYKDLRTGKYIYSPLGKPSTAQFIMP